MYKNQQQQQQQLVCNLQLQSLCQFWIYIFEQEADTGQAGSWGAVCKCGHIIMGQSNSSAAAAAAAAADDDDDNAGISQCARDDMQSETHSVSYWGKLMT